MTDRQMVRRTSAFSRPSLKCLSACTRAHLNINVRTSLKNWVARIFRRREVSRPQWVSGASAVDEKFSQSAVTASLGSLTCTAQW